MKNKKLILYLFVIYLTCVLCFYDAYTIYHITYDNSNIFGIIFFILLSIITESSMVRLKHFAVSSGFAITASSFILFGPFWAMVIISTGISLRILKYNNKHIHIFNTPFYKTLFNFSNMAISTYCASRFYFISFDSLRVNNTTLYTIKFSLFIFIFLLTNTLIISILVTILSKENVFKVWIKNLQLGTLNIIAMAPFGVILAMLYNSYNIVGMIIIMVPIMLVRYTYMLYIDSKSRYMQTVDVLMHAVEARDRYTEGHSRRVSEISRMIAKELKYSDSRIEKLTIASLVHDVGKIGIDNNILHKPSKLTDEEYSMIKEHPEIGYNILKDIKYFEDIPLLVRHHHERYDGKGYPSGKDASQLSLDVFIIQLADSIDAMATDRPYRRAMTADEITAEVIKNKGTQFHPDVVDAYFRAMKKR